jgi:hypothetical protein
MIENSVISWPPRCVAVEVNAPPALPFSAQRAHRPGLIEKARHLRRHAA